MTKSRHCVGNISIMSRKYSSCTACGDRTAGKYVQHSLLSVPICESCSDTYNSGEFTVGDSGNELYCRWCGDGGELLFCDSCPKAWCSACIHRNFGYAELNRIFNLQSRWSCFLCSPQALHDFCIANGWAAPDEDSSSKLKSNYVHPDVSRGREKFEIPVVNIIDKEPPPLDFCYITRSMPGDNVIISNNPNLVSCCTCTDNCRDASKCECAQLMGGFAYSADREIVADKPGGIYECNFRCSCHVDRCNNRVVGNGPRLKLEVFRCAEVHKGWGVRCTTDIQAGTFVADYVGEVIPESAADDRGKTKSDEYLFNLDYWGRSQACQRLSEIGMKRGLISEPRQDDFDAATMPVEVVRELLGSETTQLLLDRGVIARAHELGRRRLHEVVAAPEVERAVDIQPFLTSGIKRKHSDTEANEKPARGSWLQTQTNSRLKAWRRARSTITDRVVIETEDRYQTFTIDARWYGSIGRFLNHSCGPNLDVVVVFSDSQDIRMPRVAFFASEYIPANTELCYDYGYFAGNVEGKSRECLCGAPNCRKTLY